MKIPETEIMKPIKININGICIVKKSTKPIATRTDDIKKDNNRFLVDMPINADEIFTYKESLKREKILFTPNPQITWDLTQGRFHGQMKIEDEFKEHSETLRIISEFTGMKIDYGLVSTYRAIN